MAGARCWTLLYCLIYVSQVSSNEKGLIVSTFPNWMHYGQLNVYHGDPSSFVTEQTVGLSRHDIDYDAQVTSIAANTEHDSVLFVDAKTNTLYNFDNFNLYMNQTSQQFTAMHTGISATTSQIAYDWLSKNVYWTDGFYKWIATHPVMKKEDMSLYKVLVTKHLTKPEGIAVDPYKRYLFWSDVIGVTSKIERSNLAGDEDSRVVIVQSDSPVWISSLAVDTATQTLYWADIGRQTIETIDYDGTKTSRKVLAKLLGSAFIAISLAKDVICGSNYKDLSVRCYDKITGNNTWFTTYYYKEPWAVAVYDKDMQTKATHPCQNKKCAHICINIDQSNAKCMCKEGFKLKSDGLSCESEHGFLFGKAIIMANSTDACMYDAHISTNAKPTSDCFLTNMSGLMYFAVDSHERQFYYIDEVSMSVKQVDMISNIEKVIYTGSTAFSGFAFDWTTKNLFWTDYRGGKIIVHSVLTSATADLVTLLDSPSYITVDPHMKKMYWITGYGYTATLEEGNLDGSGLKTILAEGEISYPESLFWDVAAQKLYWINNGDLVSMKPDGSEPKYHAYVGYATHIAIYQDYTLWTTGDDTLEIAHLDSYYPDTTVYAEDLSMIKGLGVYDVDMQPMEINNCSNYNGGCQHICQPTATGMQCYCNFGYQLQADGKTCSSTPFEDSFALLPDVTHDKIYQVSLSNGELRALDIPDIDVPVSIIYDKPTKKLYWTNAIKTEIRSSPLKAAVSEILYDTWSTLPVGLAFDYSSGLLYFTTEYYWDPSFIGCIHPHVGKVHKIISNLDLPKNIALYPSKGILFWTDISTDPTRNSYIGSAFMDGTGMKKIVDTNVNSPNGIVIDYTADRVYWADADLSTISSCRLDGTDRKLVIEEPGAMLVGVDISPPYLYYVGRNKQSISKFDVKLNTKIQFMNDIHALGRIESVRVYPEQAQPENAQCKNENGECALFCLPTATGRTCACEDGQTLNADGKTCTGHITCTLKVPNAILEDRCIGHATGNWNHHINTACQSLTGTCRAFIPYGHVTPSCNKKIGTTCSYVCNAGYVPKDKDLTILCTASGAWDKPLGDLCVASATYCPNIIRNGLLDSACPRSSGSQCDFTCNQGYTKNADITALVCLGSGQWNIQGELCKPESTVRCPSTIQNGAFANPCSFKVKTSCPYVCDTGFDKNPLVDRVMCMDTGSWNFNLISLCKPAMSSCEKTFMHGHFLEPCSGKHDSKCGFVCDNGYIQQPIVQHVICNDGKWANKPEMISPQKQVSEGASSGAVVGAVIAAVVVTVIVTCHRLFHIQEKDTCRTIFEQGGITGFSNPIANQPDYGNFSHLRDEGYVTTEINPTYEGADPKDVNLDVAKSPSANGVRTNSEA
ncbi:LRP4 [Mytilus edulis]|uniref:LRP4 n=1 Tax=Mytilus edulis TaxID=6550 RepID=A0A8S3TT43_MYTED|nr:LRP4 [Mytilus edulis]